MTLSLRVLVLGAIVFAAHPVRAQYVPVDFTQQTFTAMNLASSYNLSQSILHSSMHGSASGTKSAASAVSTTTTGRGDGLGKLAATYPREQRVAALRSLTTLLDAYPKVEAMLGAPAGDVAAAMALLVVASFEAARDTNVDPALYKRVIAQFRDAIAGNPAFAKASVTERRELYQQMAVLGMLISLSRADLMKHPDPGAAQRVRDAANGYLKAFSLDPDALQITEAGLSLIPARAP